MQSEDEFLDHLRDALTHLHDPDRLRRSPLASVLGVTGRTDVYAALQRALTQAIEALEPAPDTPPQARAWRIYDLLTCRYVQQLSGPVVADQLGISLRHLRREQHAALEALAYHLKDEFGLTMAESDSRRSGTAVGPGDGPSVSDELAWLENAAVDEPTDVAEALESAIQLAQPLARQQGVRVRSAATARLPGVAAHPVALRQILLGVLSLAIGRAGRGHVSVVLREERWNVRVEVSADGEGLDGPLSDDERATLDMSYRLIDLCRGALTVSSDGREVTLSLPSYEQLPVMVIDDNADTLKLLKHFVSGTRYRMIGAQNPDEAVALAENLQPEVIVLDVMMPQMDGWQVLGLLKQHPKTGHIPVVVCTVLAQEALAASLGASGFVRKPVTQEAFLSALDRQVARTAPESEPAPGCSG